MKIRILLCDDHPIVRLGLRALLNSEMDLEVVGEANTGLQAITLVGELHPDIIIMDISMPEIDGLEATRRIRVAHPDIQVLILTVHAQDRYLFPVLKAGASGYILKSTVAVELVRAIRTVAQGGVFLYPTAMRMIIQDYLARLSHDQENTIYDGLSDREREVLKLIALGHTSSEIAEKLVLSIKSVDTYRTRIMQKLDLHTRADLVQYALQNCLVSEDLP